MVQKVKDLNKILIISVLVFILLLTLIMMLIILYNNFKKEKKKLRREYIITLNNDKIKDYKDFYRLNKRVKAIAKKIESRAINWINAESYYREEFIMEYEEILAEYEFVSNYVEGKNIREQAVTVINKSIGIINELRERENFGSTSEEVEGESKKLMISISSIEKLILTRVIELTNEKSKL